MEKVCQKVMQDASEGGVTECDEANGVNCGQRQLDVRQGGPRLRTAGNLEMVCTVNRCRFTIVTTVGR